MPLAMVAGTSWLTELKQVRSGRQRLLILDEAYYQLANPQTVSFCQETWKLGRSYGIAPIAVCHRPSDLGAQADTGTAVAKMAEGLLADSATKIVFRQAPGELTTGAELLGLSDAEADAISRLGRGEAVWRVGDLSLVARHLVPPGIAELVNTDQYMHRDTHLDPNAEALSDAA
jgi:DNA helicase HerA-like ATPase